MENNANRWIATALLLAMFGIIAYAGTRSTARQGVQNVLVTNAANQQVPVLPPARPTANGAYIVAVANAPGVKVTNAASAPVPTKEVNAVDAQSASVQGFIDLPAGGTGTQVTSSLPNATPVVIDSVSFDSLASAGEYIDIVTLTVDGPAGTVGFYTFSLQQALANNLESVYSANQRIPVPAGGTVFINTNRFAGHTQSESLSYTIAYHTVTQ